VLSSIHLVLSKTQRCEFNDDIKQGNAEDRHDVGTLWRLDELNHQAASRCCWLTSCWRLVKPSSRLVLIGFLEEYNSSTIPREIKGQRSNLGFGSRGLCSWALGQSGRRWSRSLFLSGGLTRHVTWHPVDVFQRFAFKLWNETRTILFDVQLSIIWFMQLMQYKCSSLFPAPGGKQNHHGCRSRADLILRLHSIRTFGPSNSAHRSWPLRPSQALHCAAVTWSAGPRGPLEARWGEVKWTVQNRHDREKTFL